MGSFNRDDRSGGGRGGYQSRGRSSFGGGGRSFDRGGDRGSDRPMFKTVCSNCGKECEVPFRPTNGKPVYCSDCFEKMGGKRQDSPRPERSDFRPQAPVSNQNNVQLDALNAKLEAINSKVEKIISLLEPKVIAKRVVKEVAAPKIKKVVKKASAKKE